MIKLWTIWVQEASRASGKGKLGGKAMGSSGRPPAHPSPPPKPRDAANSAMPPAGRQKGRLCAFLVCWKPSTSRPSKRVPA